MKVLLLGLCIVAGCGKTANPEVCCTDPADCSSIGAAEDKRDCPDGLACVEHECVVADCSTQGCTPQAPVCNVATNVCEGCTGNPDCATSQGQPLCDVDSGSCVQCVVSSDCGPTVPVCESNTCRKCTLDSECASGACAENGACVVDSEIVHLDPAGMDVGPCSAIAPCRTIPYAVSQSTAQRNHLVFRNGAYATNPLVLSPSDTPASRLNLHGHGASLVAATGDGEMLTATIPLTVVDLEFVSPIGTAINVGSAAETILRRVRIQAQTDGLRVTGTTTLEDFVIEDYMGNGATAVTLASSGSVRMERGEIKGWDSGIRGGASSNLEMTNVLIQRTRGLAIDMFSSQGVFRFITIADAGTDAGSGARAVVGNQGITVQSSIIWAPGTTARPAISGCNLVSSIVGPTAVAGASNADPQFVNAAAGNYHLKAGSPARDMVETGPPLDFERDPRPQGARFDIGADEGL